LTALSMFSPCTQWVFGPLSPVIEAENMGESQRAENRRMRKAETRTIAESGNADDSGKRKRGQERKLETGDWGRKTMMTMTMTMMMTMTRAERDDSGKRNNSLLCREELGGGETRCCVLLLLQSTKC